MTNENRPLTPQDWEKVEAERDESFEYLINHLDAKKHPFPEWMQSDRFLDELRASVPTSLVCARKVALKKQYKSKEYVGLSPFKFEKTPSFKVNDHKAQWFDFSTGEAGDIFDFIMKTEEVPFTVAVLKIMKEAGYTIPKKGESLERYLQRQEIIKRSRKKNTKK